MTATTSRRALLAGIAAMPVLATPVVCAPPGTDPVYAAIENYKAAYSFLNECLDKATEIEERIHARANANAEKRMLVRLQFEALDPDHKFTTSQDECPRVYVIWKCRIRRALRTV